MLGVLKRRWKPKRSNNGGTKIPSSDTNSLDSFDRDKTSTNRSHHQVHPVLDSQAFLGYDKPPLIETNSHQRSKTPPPSIISPANIQQSNAAPPPSTYPLAPNICVEAGRIQFIRSETDGGCQNRNSYIDPVNPHQNSCAAPVIQNGGRITVTRGLQTEEGEDYEQFRHIQLSLEARIAELEAALELAQRNEFKDKQTITKLQKSLNKRESAHRDADRERRLRADSETRAKQALQEASRCRSRLKILTNEFARMEDTVRSMLTYKKQADQLKQEKTALTLAFENRCKQYQATISRLNIEISSLRQQLEQVGHENNYCNSANGGVLNAHTVALQRYAEESRKQYERCLDDVANQVVRALLAQKGLKEEVGVLNTKIQELETQNRALTLMLLHQLRGGDNISNSDLENGENSSLPTATEKNCCLALEEGNNNFHNNNNNNSKKKEASISCNSSNKTSPVIMHTSLTMKHCNSFNSEFLDAGGGQCDCSPIINEKRLSADSSTVIETRLSLEDKKRHQVLTKLWTELKGTEVTPKKLLEALSAVDSSLWVPPKRPISLNLQLPIQIKQRPPLINQSSSKSEEEATGNDESPESGNRDEGYSTMSSDVQADVTRGSGDATLSRKHDLEDLKEASDETDMSDTTRLLVTDSKDPDILYIPLNLLNLKQRNSFPPGKDVLPFQHIMRSFSDSHLCIKITAAPITPCYTFSSPISSSPSFLLFDLSEKGLKRVSKGPNMFLDMFDGEEKNPSPISWSSDRLEYPSWDAEYIQQWLKLDETRSALQQHHRDLLELEYDRAELEDWSLSLSNDDLREQWKNTTTPSQISVSTLPSIQENNQLELEEDSNECLWNNSSYMADKEGRELVTLLMDENRSKQWPYADQNSPENSWSSGSDDVCSKRSSTALSDDTGELPGTDFTRDFYRLVKFESTKSLASISSINDNNLQSVLTFIAEQQKYIEDPRADDNFGSESSTRPCSLTEDVTKDFSIEGPPPSDSLNKIDIKSSDSENYVTLRQLCEEFNQKQSEPAEESMKKVDIIPAIAYANEICLVTPLDVESENCSAISEHPVDICSSVNVELLSDFQNEQSKSDINSDLTDSFTNGSESLTTSSISTSETIVSKIPLRKNSKSRLPTSPSKVAVNNNNNNYGKETKIPKSKYARNTSSSAKPKLKVAKEGLQKLVHVHQNTPATHVITSEKLPPSSSAVISNIIEGPPHRAISFHERATSKDVIEELNRMIKNGEETTTTNDSDGVKLDQACRPTGWIHVEKDVDLTDPKARANLLDVMMASVSSDSSPTSSCGGSIASDSTEDPPDYGQLHRIHKYHRQKKVHAVRPELAVVRAVQSIMRPTIIGRPEFFVRYGEKEREAVASFDFLDDMSSTASSSITCSQDGDADIDLEPQLN